MRWSAKVDRMVNGLKWPAAGLAALAAVPLAWALLRIAPRVALEPWPLVPLLFGTAAWLALWRRWLGRGRIGRLLLAVEHESTHALFALLTGHRIVGFRASLGGGGHVRFTGGGNWLIAIAPYFFPTAALLLFALAYLLPFPKLPWQKLLLGVALGYHVVSTARETHRDQSDLRQVGLPFCWLFLPAANLAVVGLLISFGHGGTKGLSQWWSDVIAPIQSLYHWIV